MRSRWKRLGSLLGLALVPSCLAPAPTAWAGGGFGITVTATMDGQGQRLLVGTVHTVHVTVLDAPGEASLRDIAVSVVDPDPTTFPVVCDAGVNGHMSLEPMRELHCTAEVTALPGARQVVVAATASVPGMPGRLHGSATLGYFGYTPPAPAVKKPVVSRHGASTSENPPVATPDEPSRGGADGDTPADPPADQSPQGGAVAGPGCSGSGGSGDSDDPGSATCRCPAGDGDPGDPGSQHCFCPPDGSGDPGSTECECPPGSGSNGTAQRCDCPTNTNTCDLGHRAATASPHSLARTGTDVALIGGAGLALAAGGLLLTRSTRRSRRNRA